MKTFCNTLNTQSTPLKNKLFFILSKLVWIMGKVVLFSLRCGSSCDSLNAHHILWYNAQMQGWKYYAEITNPVCKPIGMFSFWSFNGVKPEKKRWNNVNTLSYYIILFWNIQNFTIRGKTKPSISCNSHKLLQGYDFFNYFHVKCFKNTNS